MPDEKAVQSLPTITSRLKEEYPDARYELDWETPLQLLVATILAAQSTDVRINQVTPGLFAKYPDAKAFAEADITELEEDLKPTGFYRNKARAVQGACKGIVERFGGEVPRTMDELISLDGVARKTANVVLNNAFRIPSGVIVDTHVNRVSQRMGLTDQKRPEKIEQDLMKLVPQEEWISFGPAMVLLGRYTCTHYAPRCGECIMNDLCPRRGVDGEAPAEESTEEKESMPKTATKTATKKAPAKKTTTKKPATKAKPAAAKTTKPAAPVPSLSAQIPPSWQEVLSAEFSKPYFKQLEQFVGQERQEKQIFPPEEDVFNALKATPYDQVKVLLLGQDPYHDDGQAHGMCFSVRPGVAPPPSLVNVFKELNDDLGCKIPNNGYLVSWAEQGVLLLNTVLTVQAHKANSHKDKGWEQFTDAVISALNDREDPVVFLLWGGHAHKKEKLISNKQHTTLKAGHPSPLSSKFFFGSKPFSLANRALEGMGKFPIDWQLPDRDPKTGEVIGGAPAPRPAAKPSPKPAAKPTEPAVPAVTKVSAAVSRAASPPSELDSLPALAKELPVNWQQVLAEDLGKASFTKLEQFIEKERQSGTVYPPQEEVFRAFHLTPFNRVRVVFVGEEPQSQKGDSNGLCFSVRSGRPLSKGLKILFEELCDNLGCWMPTTGDLSPWAEQGVLLLNTVLTVRSTKAGSHRGKGWESFTDAVLRAINDRSKPVVFVLFGDEAQKKSKLIDTDRHPLLEVPEPTDRSFLGSRLFSSINNALEVRGQSSIYWQLFSV